ncbi:Hsp20/alpha crystallin family protein [Sulfurovum sp.]|uniref:Hsp20/alpha crystallin family protein n=1 Tax=Sulfurovum sp. TaxID=1969726 RepID=UPI0035641182
MKQIVSVLVTSLVLATSGVMATEKTPDTSFNPFEEIQKMQQEMGKMFERFHQKMMEEDMFSKFTFSFPSMPAMDLVDEGDSYVLETDIPGAEKNKIDITVEGRVLKIEAKTSKNKEEEGKGYVKRERFTSSYMRTITLPQDANAEKFESEYKDGVLKITIPKQKK